MDSLISLAILIGLFAGLGWLLGIIGFFKALAAREEVRELRQIVIALMAREAVAERPGEPAMAPVVPEFVEPSPEVVDPAEPPPVETLEAVVVPPPVKPKRDLEALITMRWGVWLGAAALLFAGIFLVRYAVEQSLLGPAARCSLAGLLGFALLGTAEWLQRHEGPPLPGPLGRDQAPAGLAAGGIAILFGAAYGAGPFYGLLLPLVAFAALAAVSLLGLAAALRYGQLTAAIGLAGAFATPALVATDSPSLPGLFAYLLLVSAASLFVVRHTAWTWLGWATAIAGAVWICVADAMQVPDSWVAGLFMPAAVALNLFLLPAAALDHPVGRRLAWVPFAVLAAAGLLLEAGVTGSAPRLGLFLLSPLAVAKAVTEPRLDRLPWLAALVGLATLLLWALPAWVPTGEVLTIEGAVQAVLPGAWAPQVVQPLIIAAALFAVFHAAAGSWLERRAPNPLHWAALVAAVPVVTLAVVYTQVTRFQPDAAWAVAAAVLAAALTGATLAAAREQSLQRAGTHAAGAVAALALGCAMLLHDYWLSLAVALFLPPLAWIEDRADLPPLRRVALAVATLVLVRLLANWYVPTYEFGTGAMLNGLIPGYLIPAAAFAYAAILFRRRADDLLVAVLEAGAVAFAACFVALEIRHGFGRGHLDGRLDFHEVASHVLTAALQAIGYLYLARRTGRAVLRWAGHLLGALAFVSAVLLIILNPAFTGVRADSLALLAAYLAPAALALVARGYLADPRWRKALATYALVAGFAWITLQIRQFFHPGSLSLFDGRVEDAELWDWSGAWLLYGIGLMVQGIRTHERGLRLAALGVIGLVCAKVFLIDMSGLTGLWRVLSFLGLGLTLIGLGVFQRRFVQPARQAEDAQPG
ncbi:MAG TPA: DUF2339 domain-containing protein [Aliidongia sp.]|uniref:DUF2339 domain-containing protein n=1 Tax=Aliidongia sp. TaxID=1914230 RepID=UPI002DDCD1CD|nr:DUF2339 domain-containing protein [Aliidongia sp.]HEV2674972.1 DUF2339 domain-containing protein [Aliidongia sp.]